MDLNKNHTLLIILIIICVISLYLNYDTNEKVNELLSASSYETLLEIINEIGSNSTSTPEKEYSAF